MTRFTHQDVEQIARWARLALTQEEQELLAHQLTGMVAFVAKVGEVDTAGAPLAFHLAAVQNAMRPDEIRPSWPKEQTLANAPATQDGFFRVPRILED